MVPSEPPRIIAFWPEERQRGQPRRACTITIPSDVDHVDGNKNYPQIGPGDVLCLPAGSRGEIEFENLHGTAERPITIRNSGGVVRISGGLSRRGIGLDGSSWIRLSGAGVSDACGARYERAKQECGIEIAQTHHGVLVGTEGRVHDIEIDHIYIHSTLDDYHETGIAIHPQPGQIISGFFAHDNYLSDIFREGMYIGSEPGRNPLPTNGKLVNVEVSYNRVERTGYDGIKIKVAVRDVSIHDNIVLDPALSKYLHHESGIQLARSTGSVYNNVVVGGVEGIASGRPLPGAETRYFNNIVVATETLGMWMKEDGARIYNNTIVDAGATGIQTEGSQVEIFDNIVVGSYTAAITGRNVSEFRNLTGTVASAGFLDPAAHDYHLLTISPAIDEGAPDGLTPAFDRDGVRRPQNSRSDRGAYEFSSGG